MPDPEVVFISEHGNSLPLAWRLLGEGVDCQVYVHEPEYRSRYKNMMPRLNVERLPDAVKACGRVIIDMVRPNNETLEDLALLKTFEIGNKPSSVFGAVGDKIRQMGIEVVGPSRLTDRWELYREEGIQMARRIGLKIPEYHKFTSFKEGAKFVHNGDGKGKRWVIKPNGNAALDMTYCSTFKDGRDILDLMLHTYPARYGTDKVDFILQAFIEEAVELSSALWIYKGRIVSANRTFESKKLCEGDKGPNIGSASNTVWQCKDAEGIVHKQMQKFLDYIGEQSGEVDENCMIDKNGDAWHLESTQFRFGLDALYCQQEQIKKGKRASFWLKEFQAKYAPGFAASQRLMLWPAPRIKTEADRKEIRGNLINDKLENLDDWWLQDVIMDAEDNLRVQGADGLVGVTVGLGDNMEEAINIVQKRCKELEVVGNRLYRQDHLEKHQERMVKLKKWGINII